MSQSEQAVQVLALAVTVIIMGFGTIAAALPILPGPLVVWVGAVIYAVATGFKDMGVVPLIILTVLMLLGSTSDMWLGFVGVKASGGSLWAVLGSMGGMIVGLIVFFPFGGFIGGVAGALVTEFARTGSARRALRIGGGTLGGYLIGVIAEFFFALLMDVVFGLALFWAHRAL